MKPHGLVYDKADIYYAAAVRKRLNDLKTEYHGRWAECPTTTKPRIEVDRRVSCDMVDDAELTIRNQPDSPEGRIKLMELAFADLSAARSRHA